MAAIRKGQGPNALPQGAATQVNAATPPAAAFDDELLGNMGAEIPVQFAQGEEDDSDLDTGLSENMDILTGEADPGFRPPPIADQGTPSRAPTHAVRFLHILTAGARNPLSPVGMTALYKWFVRRLEREMQRR